LLLRFCGWALSGWAVRSLGFIPQALGDFERIDVSIDRLPPSGFVAGSM
jgi:hypothetical protein